jgi:large subunit ribosomal protein L25
MAQQFKLKPIDAHTKGEVKRLRREGYIPVSIQHKGMETMHFQQEARTIDEFLKHHGNAALLDLTIEPGNKHERAIVHDVQRDPLTQQLLQITFQQVRKDDILKTQVPLVLVGEPEEVRNGDYMLQHPLDHLDVECEPNNLPEHIAVDLSSLHAGEVLRVSDLPENPHYKILTAPDTVIASLGRTHARQAEEEVATEQPARVEPAPEAPVEAEE